MNIKLEIQSFPSERDARSVIAFTEGEVSFFSEGMAFFSIEMCLLIELAIEFRKWIGLFKIKENPDFYYVSMDEEEEPIVAFVYDAREMYYGFFSCWLDNDFEVSFSKENAIEIAEKYIVELRLNILERFGFDVEEILVGTTGDLF